MLEYMESFDICILCNRGKQYMYLVHTYVRQYNIGSTVFTV